MNAALLPKRTLYDRLHNRRGPSISAPAVPRRRPALFRTRWQPTSHGLPGIRPARPDRLTIRTNALLEGAGLVAVCVAGLAALAYVLKRATARSQPDATASGKEMPVVRASVSDLTGDTPFFLSQYKWFLQHGGLYKVVLGPKVFVIVCDPVIVRHILKDNVANYGKGLLSELLGPIMGTGLIPADSDKARERRRVIVPGFHQHYYNAMAATFARCTQRTVDLLEEQVAAGGGAAEVDMEVQFLSLGLDIIGLGVFNYDFGSITSESPVIKAVYGVLQETVHRSTAFLPYWNLPGASLLVPRQRRFQADLAVLNTCLDDLIRQAAASRQEADPEALQQRDYSQVKDPSLLRFLVDMRGEDANSKQLRDDLMTLLIAGHETVAGLLTWALFCLAQNPEAEARLLAEIDSVLGDRTPGLEDIKAMPYLRAVLGESLRLYPQPPVLIRRALAPDTLPPPLDGNASGYPIEAGADIFISTWTLHRSPNLWRDPDAFRPERFSEAFTNDGFKGRWAGYQPEAAASALYPNEVASDFAFIPFGGGARKCVGDQFAMFEAAVAFAMLLRRFSFRLVGAPESVGMDLAATIHTKNGLVMSVARRDGAAGAAVPLQQAEVVAAA